MDTFTQESAAYRDNRLAHWEGVYQKSPRSLGDYYRRRLQVTYRHLVPENARVLELGCGPGDLLAAMKPATGVGIDFSPEAVTIARARHPHLEFILADAHDIDLGDRTFDYVIVSELVNDLWDVQTVIQHIRACCAGHT